MRAVLPIHRLETRIATYRLGIVLLAATASMHSVAAPRALAQTPSAQTSPADDFAGRVAAALERGRPLARKAATNYPEHRKCFSCHHQTLPMLVVASRRGTRGEPDAALLKSQAEFTQQSFENQIDDLKRGENIGGKALTVGYGLWTLGLAEWKADETTAAMVSYLLKSQEEDGHWGVHTLRPPMEGSWETSTAVAIAGLRTFATPEQKQQADAAIAKGIAWLTTRDAKTQEDKVFRLRALHGAAAPVETLTAARATILTAQREDGGWSQLDEMKSDAYASGTTLYVLCTTGTPANEAAIRRGIEFLLTTQKDDGSWYVETRSKPIQVYFDNGDPHGPDQFISTPATCWALAALELVHDAAPSAQPVEKSPDQRSAE